MKIRSVMAATLLLGSSLTFAQVCPPSASGSVCLVPSRNQAVTTYTTPSSVATTTLAVPYSTGITTIQPMTSLQPMSTCPVVGIVPMSSVIPVAGIQPTTTLVAGMQQQYISPISAGASCMYNTSSISPDTAVLVNQIAALRNDVQSLQGQIQAASIQDRGLALINRMDTLEANEMSFRQQLAANPNLPDAQERAEMLNQQAQQLNRDIAAFNTELNMIPTSQRPFLASQLSAFNVAYWQPATQRFAQYSTQFQQNAMTAYQPAFAANPWLQPWVTNYQTTISAVSLQPQQYASTSWWADTRVLGSMETYPNGMIVGSNMTLPQGSVVYIPAGSVPMGTTMMVTQ